jgi:transporter family protein
MSWIVFSILSALTFALVTVFDKVIIAKHITNTKVFILAIGISQTFMGVLVIPFVINSEYPIIATLIAILAGVICGLYLIIMFTIMEFQDVARLIPVLSTYPVFVALLAFFFLGESIGMLAWISIVITVLGAGMVSLNPSQSDNSSSINIKTTFILLLGSMFFGLSQFLAKTISDEMSVWPQFMLRGYGVGLVCCLYIFIPSVRSDFMVFMKKPRSIGLFVLSEGLLAFIAISLMFLALYAGEVYLVSTVMGTRPLFVFVLSVLLSLPVVRILSEQVHGKELSIRISGTAMTVLGVCGVSLL